MKDKESANTPNTKARSTYTDGLLENVHERGRFDFRYSLR
jgi:hypothetical protein